MLHTTEAVPYQLSFLFYCSSQFKIISQTIFTCFVFSFIFLKHESSISLHRRLMRCLIWNFSTYKSEILRVPTLILPHGPGLLSYFLTGPASGPDLRPPNTEGAAVPLFSAKTECEHCPLKQAQSREKDHTTSLPQVEHLTTIREDMSSQSSVRDLYRVLTTLLHYLNGLALWRSSQAQFVRGLGQILFPYLWALDLSVSFLTGLQGVGAKKKQLWHIWVSAASST